MGGAPSGRQPRLMAARATRGGSYCLTSPKTCAPRSSFQSLLLIPPYKQKHRQRSASGQANTCNGSVSSIKHSKVTLIVQENREGFCGPSVVVRRYLNVAATCTDLHALVMAEGLTQFAEKLPDAALTAFKDNPDSLTLNDLKVPLSTTLYQLCLTSPSSLQHFSSPFLSCGAGSGSRCRRETLQPQNPARQTPEGVFEAGRRSFKTGSSSDSARGHVSQVTPLPPESTSKHHKSGI